MTDHTPLTDQQLADIEARATNERVTPGPWRLDRESCDCGGDYPCGHGMYVTGVVTPTPTHLAVDRCKRTGEQPRDYDFHRSEICDFTDADWELMAHARTDVPALLAEVRQLRALAEDLAGRWEKEATFLSRAIGSDPLGGEIEAAQHERVRIYRESARDLRHVLATGQIPTDLLTADDQT
jgi:hypothetical protein